MRLSRRSVDFNKEILIGEIGALLGAPFFGVLGSLMSRSANVISWFTLVGSVIGASVFWLTVRIYDEKKYNDFSAKKLKRNVSLYTPVAFMISVLIGYPVVFVVTHSLTVRDHATLLSSLMGEICGFTIFLILINLYRYILIKNFNKEL